MKNAPLFALLAFVIAAGAPLHANADFLAEGPLDLPLPPTLLKPPRGGNGGAVVENLEPAAGVVDRKTLRREVRREQRKLQKLPRRELQKRAKKGERGAQVALGDDFAREAERLAFAPAAANDALSDAVRWYSLAASRGYPGVPSLDQAGVSLYPIRVHRSRP